MLTTEMVKLFKNYGVSLQQGGIVMKRTAAILGERGPEAVIPLAKLERLLGQGSRPKQVIMQNVLQGPNIFDEITFTKYLRRQGRIAEVENRRQITPRG